MPTPLKGVSPDKTGIFAFKSAKLLRGQSATRIIHSKAKGVLTYTFEEVTTDIVVPIINHEKLSYSMRKNDDYVIGDFIQWKNNSL